VISALTSDQKSALLAELLTTNPSQGVAFNLFRHTIGASDLSATVYSYDDASNPDPSLADFSLTTPGQNMVSLIAEFVGINSALKLLGSVWSPPGWMKMDGVMDGTTTNNNINMDYASSFANYFVKYIQAFAAGGVTVDAITIQNEPLNSQSGYPTMYVAADQETQLIQDYVGPALRSANLQTEIWAYDHNTGKSGKLSEEPNIIPLTGGKMCHRFLRRSSAVLATTWTLSPGIAMQRTITGMS
jgi:O-glycosyl hydrolase